MFEEHTNADQRAQHESVTGTPWVKNMYELRLLSLIFRGISYARRSGDTGLWEGNGGRQPTAELGRIGPTSLPEICDETMSQGRCRRNPCPNGESKRGRGAQREAGFTSVKFILSRELNEEKSS
jgi:hypothetical protein